MNFLCAGAAFNVLWLLTMIFNSVLAQNNCVTPKWEMGRCIPYKECGLLQRLSQQYGSNLPQGEREYLLNSRCNNNQLSVYICCKTEDIIETVTNTGASTYESSLDPRGLQILSSIKCGLSKGNRIANGQETKVAEFPWMALLKYDSKSIPFQCGGTLISHYFVLTAAHCLVGTFDKLIAVRLGEHDLNQDVDCTTWGSKTTCMPPPEDVGVEKIIPHPEYSRTRLVNDVGLVKLDRYVDFKIHIKPVCLPITEQSTELMTDQKYFIAGWGTTENKTTSSVLLKATIPHKDNQVCQNAFKRVKITQNHICAGGENKTDSCRGDSGGPLFFLHPYKSGGQRYIQFGVVSFGYIVCGGDEVLPAVYCRITDVMPWITKNIDA